MHELQCLLLYIIIIDPKLNAAADILYQHYSGYSYLDQIIIEVLHDVWLCMGGDHALSLKYIILGRILGPACAEEYISMRQ